MDKIDAYLTQAQVCEMLGKPSRRTTQNWLNKHRVTRYRHPTDGRVNLYLRSEVEEALRIRRKDDAVE